ncbi:MAG: heme-binding domain-containing protein [Chitinophagaceae bacterium]
MSVLKKTLLAVLIVFIIIQFIQPTRNKIGQMSPTDITKIFTVPQNVQGVLKTSCYDCHSNDTHYPWYSFIQPGAWWMARHIDVGKKNLNFSEFGSYSKRKKQNKLRSIAKSIEDETMPIGAYTIMHGDAKLSKDKNALIVDWINRTRDSLSKTN